MLKKFLILMLLLIAAPFIAALFIKSDYEVSVSRTIDRPVDEVFDYIRLLKHQDEFSVWARMDPNMQQHFTGTDGEPGFVSAWESSNPQVGKGEQEIMAMVPGKRIDYALRFIEPFASNDKAYLITEPIEDGSTLVTWGFVGHMAYPMNLLIPLMDVESLILKDLDSGLANLKQILERPPTPVPE
ncbi:SRPBCC family protein [Shewanella litorisediminis]|uniref:SRPBCC family protein n=1 Tax=Shewanella litorisediminis TaxID=1173586 RepID=A0ABX7G222_9GAMM|nr:SRPBCC family protein [Shewanella litorisediminis]MCL2918548.1 SRPBCC family protein [Shewanella litorisediminis]QRH01374.1 SRPBCC family protein [Shewanella litorisediminis]